MCFTYSLPPPTPRITSRHPCTLLFGTYYIRGLSSFVSFLLRSLSHPDFRVNHHPSDPKASISLHLFVFSWCFNSFLISSPLSTVININRRRCFNCGGYTASSENGRILIIMYRQGLERNRSRPFVWRHVLLKHSQSFFALRARDLSFEHEYRKNIKIQIIVFQSPHSSILNLFFSYINRQGYLNLNVG